MTTLRTPTWWNSSRQCTWRRITRKWLSLVLCRDSGRQAGLFELAGRHCGGRWRNAHGICSCWPAEAPMAKRCCWRIWCMSMRQGARQALRLRWIPAEATMTWMMMRGEMDSLTWRSDPREGRTFMWIHGRTRCMSGCACGPPPIRPSSYGHPPMHPSERRGGGMPLGSMPCDRML
jgi:hypothetical protein